MINKSKSPLTTVTFTLQQLTELLLVIFRPGRTEAQRMFFKMITLTWSEFLLHSGFPGPWFQVFISLLLGSALCCAFSSHIAQTDKKKKLPFAFELEEFVDWKN